MKLKDIADMEEYLAHRCYCPGEIYSCDGFFYQIFKPGAECKMMGKSKKFGFTAAICKSDSKEATHQIIIISIHDNKVMDTERFDATENNIKGIKEIINGNKDSFKHDEYEAGSTKKALNEIMSIADAVMID